LAQKASERLRQRKEHLDLIATQLALEMSGRDMLASAVQKDKETPTDKGGGAESKDETRETTTVTDSSRSNANTGVARSDMDRLFALVGQLGSRLEAVESSRSQPLTSTTSQTTRAPSSGQPSQQTQSQLRQESALRDGAAQGLDLLPTQRSLQPAKARTLLVKALRHAVDSDSEYEPESGRRSVRSSRKRTERKQTERTGERERSPEAAKVDADGADTLDADARAKDNVEKPAASLADMIELHVEERMAKGKRPRLAPIFLFRARRFEEQKEPVLEYVKHVAKQKRDWMRGSVKFNVRLLDMQIRDLGWEDAPFSLVAEELVRRIFIHAAKANVNIVSSNFQRVLSSVVLGEEDDDLFPSDALNAVFDKAQKRAKSQADFLSTVKKLDILEADSGKSRSKQSKDFRTDSGDESDRPVRRDFRAPSKQPDSHKGKSKRGRRGKGGRRSKGKDRNGSNKDNASPSKHSSKPKDSKMEVTVGSASGSSSSTKTGASKHE
jgi:hypothetical protein